MAGHSKWAQIKRQKAVSDAERSKAFSKIARIITIAGRDGADPNFNFKLKSAIEKAKELGAPKDLIERAISKAAGKDKGGLEEVLYEAYGPLGSAFIITGITDSKNRTTQEIRNILEEHNAKMVNPGAAMFLFYKVANEFQPKQKIAIADEEEKNELKTLLNALDEHEDIQEIYSNLEKDPRDDNI